MKTANLFIITTTGKVCNQAETPRLVPEIRVGVGEWLQVVVAFMDADGVISALADGTAVRMVLKADLAHGAGAIALDTVATESGSGTSKRYTLKALIDGATLRTQMAGRDEKQYKLQINWGTAEAESYGISAPVPVKLTNNYSLSSDAIPQPLEDEGWAWLKERLPEEGGFVHDEETKTISTTGGSVTFDIVGGALRATKDGNTIEIPGYPVA